MKSGDGFLLLDAMIWLGILVIGVVVSTQAFEQLTQTLHLAEQEKSAKQQMEKDFIREQGFNAD